VAGLGFSKSGFGPLVALDENFDSKTYLNLLKNNILPKIRPSSTTVTFMHDNAPCHTSSLLMALRSIENLWGLIKRELWSEFPTPNTRAHVPS
jgi:hypothetical protein